MKKKSVIKIIFNVLIFLTAIALLSVATKHDLEISHKLSGKNLAFGRLFAVIGEYPAYFALIFSTFVFYANSLHKKMKYIKIYKVLALIAVFLSFFIFAKMSHKEVEVPNETLLALSSGVIGALFVMAIAKISRKDIIEKLVKFAVFTLVVMAVSFVIIRVMKYTWSRVRYRDMIAQGNNFEAFTQWFSINGFSSLKTKATSFPSGHSASAANIFIIAALSNHFKSLKKYKWILYIVSFVFTILTAISRIIVNAHFLSDVIVGAGISYLVYILFNYIFFFKKDIREQLMR